MNKVKTFDIRQRWNGMTMKMVARSCVFKPSEKRTMQYWEIAGSRCAVTAIPTNS